MKELKFVDVGEGITEGHVQKFLVQDGQQVKEDQPVVQVETDKAVVTVPAPVSGTVKLNVKEGSDVHVGDTIAYFGTPDELRSIGAQPSAQSPAAAVQKPAVAEKPVQRPQQQAAPPVQQVAEILAAPSVRKLARDMKVDITKVKGTGPQGRITETDLRAYAASAVHGMVKPMEDAHEQHPDEEVERVPMSQVRKAIARNMELAHTIPFAAHMDLIDATHLWDIVMREKPRAEKLGVKLTFTPFILKAVIQALRENPRFNASYDRENQEIIVKKYYNIGFAAEADDGLRVIVVKGADRKSMLDIAREMQDLRKKLEDKTISMEEMNDTSFTITNIGSLGGGFLSVPVINYPDVAILAIHMIREMPVVKDGKIAIGRVLPITVVLDHRVVDGAEGVRFANAVKGYLEDPEFLEMMG